MATDPRPLSARLDAYIANLQSIIAQVDGLAGEIGARDAMADTTALRDLTKTYAVVVDDLTQIVNGERLDEFRIEVSGR